MRSGEPGVQLTWMDAKVGDWVVTPRIGKPVEINALWYNALCTIDGFAQLLGRNPSRYRDSARVRALRSSASGMRSRTIRSTCSTDRTGMTRRFARTPSFAVSLPFRPFDSRRERAIVDRVEHELWTTLGLRSLAPSIRRMSGTMGDRRTTATPHITAALRGPFSQEPLLAPTQMRTATLRAPAASSKRLPRVWTAMASVPWPRSLTAIHRTMRAAASRRRGASAKFCERGTLYRMVKFD